MAKQYAEQEVCWKFLEENRTVVPLELWGYFDRFFTKRVEEAKSIYVDSDYKISRTDAAIIMGLVQSSGDFIKKIKSSPKNEIDGNGVFTVDYNISQLLHHCLGNDLNAISFLTELKFSEDVAPKKELIEQAFNELLETITKLKKLTIYDDI